MEKKLEDLKNGLKERKMPKCGDILLIKTKYCLISWLVRKLTKSEFNHCALVLDKDNILDPTSNRITIKSINSYSNKLFYKRKFIKIANLNYDEKMNIINTASLVTNDFKFEWHKFIISLYRIYKKKYPLVLTCSSFISKILIQNCHISLPKKYYLITPEDLYQMRIK